MRTLIAWATALLLLALMGSTADAALPRALRRADVTMPRAWLTAPEALIAAHRQAGLKYAVTPPRFSGLIGPFQPGETLSVGTLVERVAASTGTSAEAVGSVVVFDPRRDGDVRPAEDPRQYVHRLALDGRSGTAAPLAKLAAHDDPSVRVQALAALHRLEGDFIRQVWPGRVSIFELLRDRLDRQALLWLLTEGSRQASPTWQRVANVLGRSREPYMYRHTWEPVWVKTPGTIRAGLYAMGRSGDGTASGTLGKRIRKSFTNDPTDRYLAAVALGELNGSGELRRNARHSNAEVRRAAVLGLGLCRPAQSVIAQLERSLADSDAAARYLACLSLGRLGTGDAVSRLTAIAKDPKRRVELRGAALDGLAVAGQIEPALDAAGDNAAAVRSKAADVLGELGGARAAARLTALMGDADRWVRASAACALGRLGSREAVRRAAQYLAAADTGADERIAAVIGLGRGRSPLAAEPLGKVALDVQQPRRLRRYAVLALARLANHAGQPTLKTLTEFDTPAYLDFALRHLELDTPAATAAYVSKFLARGRRSTSAGAAARLMDLGCGAGVRELLEGSNVFDNHSRMMHMWGAIQARGPEVVPALVAATKSRRASIRRAAALALGGRTDVAAVDTLLGLTRDRSARVRAVTAQSLGLCGDPKATPALIELAQTDQSSRVTSAAIRALRFRAFCHHPDVKALFKTLAGTPRDAGVIDPARPPVAQQPPHSFALRRWPGALDDDSICNVTYESSLTYDSDRGQVVLWGAHGRRADAPQTGQTWFLDADSGRWTRLITSREWPNATCCIWSTTYDPANRVVISPVSGRGGHGWVNALRVNMQYSLPWVLDARTRQWYPARPAKHKGTLNMLPNSYDHRHGLPVWNYGKVVTYDAYANTWWTMSSSGAGPGRLRNTGGQMDPVTGRFIVVAPKSTWAYHTARNTWADLQPKGRGPYGNRMVYDAANDVMLVFKPNRGVGVAVSVYHLRENRWEHLPLVHPSPHYATFDVAYDSRHNVTVISGGWETGGSGETTVRETWTYRYRKPAEAPAVSIGRPRGLTATTLPGGKVRLTWKPPAAGKPVNYSVFRGTGDPRVFRAKWNSVANLKAGQLQYTDTVNAKPPALVFYRVTAVDAAGTEGPCSYPAQTAPPAPRWAAAAFTPGGVRLSWAACPAADLAGYHVYRAPVPARSYWKDRFDAMALAGKFVRLTKTPLKSAEFLDRSAPVNGPASELAWPESCAYLVRAVNAWGLEGGQSPTTLALPDAPGPVRVIPWLDGRRIVLWTPSRAQGVAGYSVMRMDDWNRNYAFRAHPVPLCTAGFRDDSEFPRSDRRRYYVSGIDAIGALGTPSSGAWSHGFP